MRALWTTPFPSRFVPGSAAIGSLLRVRDASGTHPSTASRGSEGFECCPTKCMAGTACKALLWTLWGVKPVPGRLGLSVSGIDASWRGSRLFLAEIR
jgi:hypothetical protein